MGRPVEVKASVASPSTVADLYANVPAIRAKLTSPEAMAARPGPYGSVDTLRSKLTSEPALNVKVKPVETSGLSPERRVSDADAPSNATAIAGTSAGAARDTALFRQARAELGPKATVSDVAQRAQQLKEAPASESRAETPALYRSRDVGEKGIPYRPETRSSATTTLEDAQRLAPGREATTGQAQEIVSVPLDRVPAFSVKPGPSGVPWIKLHSDVPEAEIAKIPPQSSVRPVSAEKAVYNAIDRSLGVKKISPKVPLKDQPLAGEPQFSSRPDKAVLQKAGASDATIERLLKLSNVELRQLAISLGEDMGQQTIGRAKLSGSVPRETVFERLLKRHSPDAIARAVDQGKHHSGQ